MVVPPVDACRDHYSVGLAPETPPLEMAFDPIAGRILSCNNPAAGVFIITPHTRQPEATMNIHSKTPSDIIGLPTPPPLSRRGFFMTASAAAAAGYTLAAGPVRAQVVTTDTTGLKVGDATVKVAGGDMPVYFARPEKAKNPPVILVNMEIFGLHEYIKDVTRRLAKAGAFAIAPNYYFRSGEDLTKITEMPKLMPIVNAKTDAELFADLDATVAWAKSQGGNTNRLGIMGFCRGGRTVWEYAAHSKNLKAGVAFYGTVVDPPAQKAIWPKSPTSFPPRRKPPCRASSAEPTK